MVHIVHIDLQTWMWLVYIDLFLGCFQLRLKAEHVSQELKIENESEIVVKKGAKKTRQVLFTFN